MLNALRPVFTGTRMICEGREWQKNGKVHHSYFRLQKFARHTCMRGFGSNIQKRLQILCTFLVCKTWIDIPEEMLNKFVLFKLLLYLHALSLVFVCLLFFGQMSDVSCFLLSK